MFFSFLLLLILHLIFFQKFFINSCLENLTLILFKKYEISFEEIKILKKYAKKELVSIYLNHKQTKSAAYFIFLCGSKFLKAYEIYLVMVIKLELSFWSFLINKQHKERSLSNLCVCLYRPVFEIHSGI